MRCSKNENFICASRKASFILQFVLRATAVLLMAAGSKHSLWAQGRTVESDLERLMIRYEELALKAYQEKQALSPTTAAINEIAAFDSVISAYAERVLEIYDTLHRIKGLTLENHRKSAARVLILRALAFVENGTPDPARRERACRDYRRALLLTRGSTTPIISQQLPYEVWIGNRLFTRLADLLDEKDRQRILLGCMRNLRNEEKSKE